MGEISKTRKCTKEKLKHDTDMCNEKTLEHVSTIDGDGSVQGRRMKGRPYFNEVPGDGQLVKDDSGEKGTIGRRGARPDSLEATAQQHI